MPDYARQAFMQEIAARERDNAALREDLKRVKGENLELVSALHLTQAECRGLKYSARQKIVIEMGKGVNGG